MKLYHLTSAHFGVIALALRRLKVSRLSELNDPFELAAVEAETPTHEEYFRRLKAKIDATHGVLCFSQEWRNPLLWGHYADRLRGVALGFEVTSTHLVPVLYENSPIKVETDPANGLPVLSGDAVDRLQRLKFKDWSYEQEMRVYVKLDPTTEEGGLFFYPFDAQLVLTEVVLGPRCDLPIAELQHLLDSLVSPVTVTRSRLDPRTFSVVPEHPHSASA